MGLGQSVEDLSFGFNSLCFLGGSKMGRVGEKLPWRIFGFGFRDFVSRIFQDSGCDRHVQDALGLPKVRTWFTYLLTRNRNTNELYSRYM